MIRLVALWDAGTEKNEVPGVGPNQAPRQAAPNTGGNDGTAKTGGEAKITFTVQ